MLINGLVLGRSMGSRAAVGVCCDKIVTDFVIGVICLSYPLHTPKECKQLRDGPLYTVTKPILFVSGTNDEMCDQSMFEPILGQLTSYQIYWIDGGNHGLEVKGKLSEEIILKICEVISTWIQEILFVKSKRIKGQKPTKKKMKNS